MGHRWFKEGRGAVFHGVNGLRRDRSLDYEARIHLQVWCNETLRAALEKNLEYLRAETLSDRVTFHPYEVPGGALEGNAGDEPYKVDLATVSSL